MIKCEWGNENRKVFMLFLAVAMMFSILVDCASPTPAEAKAENVLRDNRTACRYQRDG